MNLANTKVYLYSASPGTLSKIDHTLRHKANLNKYKKIENSLHPIHHRLKLDLNNRKHGGKNLFTE